MNHTDNELELALGTSLSASLRKDIVHNFAHIDTSNLLLRRPLDGSVQNWEIGEYHAPGLGKFTIRYAETGCAIG